MPAWDVRVACVWVPQLPLRVEVLRHPAWDGRPLVLGGAPGERKVVHLCSPEAEAAGVRLDLRGLDALYGSLGNLEQAMRGVVPPLLRPRFGFGGGKFIAAAAARTASV